MIFRKAGISLDPPNALTFDVSNGELAVTTTPADWERVEAVLDQFNKTPPQVCIEVKLTEVTPARGEEQRPFSWLADSKPGLRQVSARKGAAALLTDTQFRSVIRALEQRTGADLLVAPRVTTLSPDIS